MSEEKNAVLLFGPPGNGKSTVADKMRSMTGVDALMVGRILRNEAGSGSIRGEKIKPHMRMGRLAPTPMLMESVISLLKEDWLILD